jgi:hypothetical protein
MALFLILLHMGMSVRLLVLPIPKVPIIILFSPVTTLETSLIASLVIIAVSFIGQN